MKKWLKKFDLFDNYMENYREQYKMQQQTLDAEQICDMLKRLESMILARTENIAEVLFLRYSQ